MSDSYGGYILQNSRREKLGVNWNRWSRWPRCHHEDRSSAAPRMTRSKGYDIVREALGQRSRLFKTPITK